MTRSAPPLARTGVAEVTLVLIPLLAFDAFRLPGIVSLAMILPLSILIAAYCTKRSVGLPIWDLSLVAVLAFSVTWSDVPNYSSERLRTYLPLLLATVFASRVVSSERAMRCLKISVAIMLASSIGAILLDPGNQVRGGTVYVHAQFPKNTYGGLLAIGLLLLLERRRRANLVLVPSLAVLLALNQSVTAWGVALVMGLAAMASRWILGKSGMTAARPVLAVLGIVGTGAACLLSLFDASNLLHLVGKDPTLTERTAIWSACWEQIRSAPILGHGAFAFLEPESGSPTTQYVWAQFLSYRPPHPHNGLLDLWGQLGVLGIVAYGGLVLHGMVAGSRSALRGSEVSRSAVLCLMFIVVFGVTEPTYLGPWLVVTLMCVGSASGTSAANEGGSDHGDRGSQAARPRVPVAEDRDGRRMATSGRAERVGAR